MMACQVKPTGLSGSVLTTVSAQNHKESPQQRATPQGTGRIKDSVQPGTLCNRNDLAAKTMYDTALCTHSHFCQNYPLPSKDGKHKAINSRAETLTALALSLTDLLPLQERDMCFKTASKTNVCNTLKIMIKNAPHPLGAKSAVHECTYMHQISETRVFTALFITAPTGKCPNIHEEQNE